jgi:hypothetical protein
MRGFQALDDTRVLWKRTNGCSPKRSFQPGWAYRCQRCNGCVQGEVAPSSSGSAFVAWGTGRQMWRSGWLYDRLIVLADSKLRAYSHERARKPAVPLARNPTSECLSGAIHLTTRKFCSKDRGHLRVPGRHLRHQKHSLRALGLVKHAFDPNATTQTLRPGHRHFSSRYPRSCVSWHCRGL